MTATDRVDDGGSTVAPASDGPAVRRPPVPDFGGERAWTGPVPPKPAAAMARDGAASLAVRRSTATAVRAGGASLAARRSTVTIDRAGGAFAACRSTDAMDRAGGTSLAVRRSTTTAMVRAGGASLAACRPTVAMAMDRRAEARRT